jgi:hypothetical protein
MATAAAIARKKERERKEREALLEEMQKDITTLKGLVTKLTNRVKELESGK